MFSLAGGRCLLGWLSGLVYHIVLQAFLELLGPLTSAPPHTAAGGALEDPTGKRNPGSPGSQEFYLQFSLRCMLLVLMFAKRCS